LLWEENANEFGTEIGPEWIRNGPDTGATLTYNVIPVIPVQLILYQLPYGAKNKSGFLFMVFPLITPSPMLWGFGLGVCDFAPRLKILTPEAAPSPPTHPAPPLPHSPTLF
jgi:hypothetical protein